MVIAEAAANKEETLALPRENSKETATTTESANGGGSSGEQLSTECLIKHPLQNQCTLWYLESDRTKSWEDLQNKINTFESVEDFWSLYIQLASEIRPGSDYTLFKKGVRPMWEYQANKIAG